MSVNHFSVQANFFHNESASQRIRHVVEFEDLENLTPAKGSFVMTSRKKGGRAFCNRAQVLEH